MRKPDNFLPPEAQGDLSFRIARSSAYPLTGTFAGCSPALCRRLTQAQVPRGDI